MDENSRISGKNRRNWDDYSEKYVSFNHSEAILEPVLKDPARAFHGGAWDVIREYIPDMNGMRVCVPSSGDNLAVFAMALMGAKVTSCDISQKMLDAAERTASRLGIGDLIEFIRADTMELNGIADSAYDFVYTSNGVHVWISDLKGMYRNIHRIMKPGGIYAMFDIHPFIRPFDDGMRIQKPYTMTGPFEDESNVTFHWRMQDIINAMISSGISLERMEELSPEKSYERPFWISNHDIINGLKVSMEEVDRMYDWRHNPAMALPAWLCAVGRKAR